MSTPETPWYHRSALTAAACLVLVLLGITAARVFSRTWAPGAPVDPPSIESMRRFEDPPIPESDNAARWLEAGAAAIVWSGIEGKAIGEASTLPFGEWSPELEAQVRQTLDRNQGALITLRNALGAEATSLGIPYSEGIDMEMPELLPLLRTARMLVADARLAFAEGDVERGTESLRIIKRMVTTLARERTLLTALVSVAVDRMLVVAASEAATSTQHWAWQDSTLAEIDEVATGYGTRAMFDRVSEAWGTLMCHYIVEGQNIVQLRNGELVEFSSDCNCDIVQGKVTEVMDLVDLPFGMDAENFKAVTEGAACGSGTLYDLEGFGKAIARAQSVDAQRQLLRALVAMRRLGLEKGRYPSARPDLESLAVADPFTGEKISYVLNPDGSLTLALVGATEILEPITVAGATKTLTPMTLPPPGD